MASVGEPVPVTLAKRRVSVPPGVAVPGVARAVVTAAEPPAVAPVTPRNCMLLGRASVRSRFVTVWPLATWRARVSVRGKFGPVAVSSSVPL